MDGGLELLMTRRSIRKYRDTPVSEEAVEKILRAAMAAPSAGNEQPWHFVVIRDRDTMVRIAEVHPHAQMLKEAPLCIAVLADLALARYEGCWVQDTSAATQNILLAAHALGLGAVWLGVHPVEGRERDVGEILRLPDGVECLSLLAIGHPDERPAPADRYEPDRIHYERW